MVNTQKRYLVVQNGKVVYQSEQRLRVRRYVMNNKITGCIYEYNRGPFFLVNYWTKAERYSLFSNVTDGKYIISADIETVGGGFYKLGV